MLDCLAVSMDFAIRHLASSINSINVSSYQLQSIQTNTSMLKHEPKLRLIGIPVLAVIMSLVLGWEDWQAGGWAIAAAIGKAFVFTFCIWEGNRQIMLHLYRKWPEVEQTKKRVITEVALVFVYTLAANFLIKIAIHTVFPSLGFSEDHSALEHMLSALIPTALLLSVYESMYFFSSWKANVERREALMRANAQSQFEALKKQLDPHFLFNCMNTLASLIDVENKDAQTYLSRLSEVYRYVLDTREKSTVTLEEELQFLNAYVYLNEVRFRENLKVEQSLDQSIYRHRLPALSLQLLVENAIKHNVASRDHPLTIRIYQEGEYVTVENNKRIKNTLPSSTRLGLQNIVKRYQLLTAQHVSIKESDKLFRVQIPLLDPVSA